MIGLDFTLKKYEELCKAIKKAKYPVIRMMDYFENLNNKKFIILRHDVDKLPENALAMANLENTIGIRSTYYFRTKPYVFDIKIIKEISSLGHEIGYHYENLTDANGNFEEAIKTFEQNLKKFRKIVKIKTICMHGSPLSKWNNSDIWKIFDFKEFGILGEPYLTIDYKNIGYLTDTGRTWCNRGSVRDFVENSLECGERIKSTDDLIVLIKNQELNKLIILAHPQRWSLKSSKWIKELVTQNVKNIGKDLILKKNK